MQTTKNNPNGIRKAIIKIKPELLLNALESLTSPIGKENLIGYAFEKMGYRIIDQRSLSKTYMFDLLIEKENKQYAIEIKDYKGLRYLHVEDLDRFLMGSDHEFSGIERILFIDTSRVTNAVREREKEIPNFRIIDIVQVKEMLKDNPIDILA